MSRKKEALLKKFFAVFCLVALLAVAASADIYIKSKSHTDAMSMMGQTTPAQDTIMETWLGNDVFAMSGAGLSGIIDLKKNVAYLIIPESKAYVESPLPLDMSKLMPPEMAAMMGGGMKATVAVKPNGQTKTVGSWPCAGYDVDMTITMMMTINMKMTIWASEKVPFNVAEYMDKFAGPQMAMTMQLDAAGLAEMKKIKGFPILTETSGEVMGAQMKSTQEVVEISKKTPPADVYAVPAGFKKQANFSIQDWQSINRR
jgi:hypothetical protein